MSAALVLALQTDENGPAQPRPRPALPLALAAGACIERPWTNAPPRSSIDRAALKDVLVAATPPTLVPVGASFGNGAVELVGYTSQPPQLVPGQPARVTLYWRCKKELEAWHIFVHLDDATGSGERIHAEHDPADGRFPTDAWQPSDLVADAFVIAPDRSSLQLFVGFYSTGETRLKLDSPGRGRNDGNNRLLAGILQLAGERVAP